MLFAQLLLILFLPTASLSINLLIHAVCFFCLFVCLFFCLSAVFPCLSVYLSVFVCLSVCLSLSVCVSLSVQLRFCLSVCLSVWLSFSLSVLLCCLTFFPCLIVLSSGKPERMSLEVDAGVVDALAALCDDGLSRESKQATSWNLIVRGGTAMLLMSALCYKAGRTALSKQANTTRVVPDPRRGQLMLARAHSGELHWMWDDGAGNVLDDIVVDSSFTLEPLDDQPSCVLLHNKRACNAGLTLAPEEGAPQFFVDGRPRFLTAWRTGGFRAVYWLQDPALSVAEVLPHPVCYCLTLSSYCMCLFRFCVVNEAMCMGFWMVVLSSVLLLSRLSMMADVC